MTEPTVPPWEVLAEVMAQAGMTAADLARATKRDAGFISRILSGKYPIGPMFALDLERVLPDSPAEDWVTLQAHWYVAEAREKHRAGRTRPKSNGGPR